MENTTGGRVSGVTSDPDSGGTATLKKDPAAFCKISESPSKRRQIPGLQKGEDSKQLHSRSAQTPIHHCHFLPDEEMMSPTRQSRHSTTGPSDLLAGGEVFGSNLLRVHYMPSGQRREPRPAQTLNSNFSADSHC